MNVHMMQGAISGLRLRLDGVQGVVLEEPGHPERGSLWMERVQLLRLLDPQRGAAAFHPQDEFVLLYRGPGLYVERVGSFARPRICLRRLDGLSFSLTPTEWNALIEASAPATRALQAGEGVSWSQLSVSAERSAA